MSIDHADSREGGEEACAIRLDHWRELHTADRAGGQGVNHSSRRVQAGGNESMFDIGRPHPHGIAVGGFRQTSRVYSLDVREIRFWLVNRERAPANDVRVQSLSADFLALSVEDHQILVNVDGRCKWHYKDNDGNLVSIEGGPGDIVYLPGAENRVEVVGDESHTHVGFLKRPRVHRIEHLLGGSDDLYDPKDSPAAFVYDDMNDRLVHPIDNAVSK